MRNINRHSNGIHSPDDGDTKIGDAFVAAFCGTVANHVPGVISELRDTLAESVKEVDVRKHSELFGVLQPQKNADLSGSLYPLEISRAVDSHQVVGVIGNESVPCREEFQHFEISISPAHADADVKNIDS